MGGKITIRKKMDDYSISLDVFGEDGGVIVSYSFKSITAGTDVGKRLVLITLLRYSIMMTLNVEEILVDFEISKYEADYIQGEIDNFVYYSKINHNLAMKKPIIVYRNIAENFKYNTIISLNCGYKQFVVRRRYTNFRGRKMDITIFLLNSSIKIFF